MTEDLVQGSDEWKAARIGSLGASVVHEVIAKTKSGFAATRANRLSALLLERLTGKAKDIFQTPAMLQGIEREPEARAAYTFVTNNSVRETGLYLHPQLAGTHASPDGLVGEDGLVEIKCPEPTAHLETLLNQKVPDKYIVQSLWQMRCTNRKFCDYVSYNPDFPAEMRIWIKRITWDSDDGRIFKIEKEVREFLDELDSKIEQLKHLYGYEEAA